MFGTCRYLSPQFKKLLSPSNPFLKFSISTISTTTTNHVGDPPSRPGPPPIRVDITESAGRGVFANRRIEAAELIHTAKPVVSHPSLSKIDCVCYLCLKKLKFRNDSHTRIDGFCSEECRQEAKAYYELEKKADWSNYNKYCRDLGLKYPLLVKRLACMVIAGAASADCVHILQPAHIIPKIEAEYSMLRSAIEGLNITKENLNFLSEQWYADVLARIRINAFRIEMVAGSYDDLHALAAASVEAESGVGNAVYILPSFYNHDCDPNVHIIWMDSVHARLKALRDIEEDGNNRIFGRSLLREKTNLGPKNRSRGFTAQQRTRNKSRGWLPRKAPPMLKSVQFREKVMQDILGLRLLLHITHK